MNAPSACILVLNYNGKSHLQECLASALVAARRYSGECTVVCVDNRSTDGSREYVREAFPEVHVIETPVNDFLFSLNAVVHERREEIAIVVNNDMRFDEDFVAPLAAYFEAPEVFAVGAAILDWAGATDTVGPRCARVHQCWFYKWWRYDRQLPALTLEACGGAAAYRRRMFDELGGFDPLYRPGYYEDLDLSYRGWARGWTVIYEPRSRAYHKESVSMLARYGNTGKARLLYRNHLLFTLKNIGGPGFLLGFFLLLPLRVLRPMLRGDLVPLAGLLRALPSLPAALGRRLATSPRRLNVDRFNTVMPLDPNGARLSTSQTLGIAK